MTDININDIQFIFLIIGLILNIIYYLFNSYIKMKQQKNTLKYKRKLKMLNNLYHLAYLLDTKNFIDIEEDENLFKIKINKNIDFSYLPKTIRRDLLNFIDYKTGKKIIFDVHLFKQKIKRKIKSCNKKIMKLKN